MKKFIISAAACALLACTVTGCANNGVEHDNNSSSTNNSNNSSTSSTSSTSNTSSTASSTAGSSGTSSVTSSSKPVTTSTDKVPG